jgi:site-specific recombinase XerC
MAEVIVPLPQAIAAFLRSREASGCTAATLSAYSTELARVARTAGVSVLTDLTTERVEGVLLDRRAEVKPISAHRTYRTLRTFCRWCVRTGRLTADPMAGITMKAPKTLPRVPTDEDVRRLLDACFNTPEGQRTRALIALAADAGLRKEELRRLRLGDLDFATRTIRVHSGKGQKDGVTFFGETTASMLRTWLEAHPDPRPATFVYCTRKGIQLGPWAIARILYRLSRRAGLARRIGPHALRHYAATTVWRRSGDLALVQRLLRHETLTMALRDVAVSQADVAAKFQRASPLDHLWAGPEAAKQRAWGAPAGRASQQQPTKQPNFV